ncbi:Positive regulator of purine utilization-like protein [Cladobotryum mycophilum]|uniref:Positive regulator of purine utilization-like protein n=1 Tax=Cladobotryum mycophilum TaxID=491253 RepID=A0ABR0SHU4_9HYPO
MDQGIERSNSASDIHSIGSSTQPAPRRARTRARVSAACVRCQKRKIRCDGVLPICSACQKAGARCIDGGTSRQIPRNYMTELEARVAWLESIVREKCPEVDLSAGPGQPSTSGQAATEPPENQDAHDSPDKTSSHGITEQIGLISVSAGADLRYLGPSSGLFFTKYVLAGLSRAADIEASSLHISILPYNDDLQIAGDVFQAEAQDLPLDRRHTMLLSQMYFDTVHLQFPFLHEPTHMEIIGKLYDGAGVEPEEEFQVFLVLAIGATILSRRSRRYFSAEGFYVSATQRLDSIFGVASLTGIQCNLLLEMYSMYSPSSGLSLWTLHYQSLASTLELGLQRDVRSIRHFTSLQIELRTRVFWSVYTMDRLLSTTMGRPIGLVDEQCELRIPMDISDHELTPERVDITGRDPGTLTNMSSAIHLFKLSRFATEIKCTSYCVDREYPPYTTPRITDPNAWLPDILSRLRKWRMEIPRYPEGDRRYYLNHICDIKYHELMMLLLRPSPMLRQPTKAAIGDCFSSAIDCSKLYATLYRENQLQYGWITIHSLFLCTITLFYCVWTPNGVADDASFDFDSLASALKSTSDILSAIGEYWPEAKRSRDVLDRIFTATMRRFSRRQYQQEQRSSSSSLAQFSGMPPTETWSSTFGGVGEPTIDAQPLQDLSAAEISQGMDINFPPYLAAQLDSFMTTDWLSYFMSSDEFGHNAEGV